MEDLTGFDEFQTVVSTLFAVLLLFLLLVRFGRDFAGVVHVVDRVEIFLRNLFRRKRLALLCDLFTEHEVGIVNGFQKPERLGILVRKRGKVHRLVRNDFVADLAVHGIVYEHVNFPDARVLNVARLFFADGFALRRKDLARFGMHDIVRDAATGKTVSEVEFLIEFVSADFHHVVTAGIEEQIEHVLTHGFLGGNFAGAQSSVKRDQPVRFRFNRRVVLFVLIDGGGDHLVPAEQLFERAVGTVAERAEKHRRRELSLAVHAHPKHALRILFEFQPGAAVGDHGRFVNLFPRLVRFRNVVHAGRTHELGDDHALRAVDDERAVLGHQGKIPHKDVLFENLVLYLVYEPHLHPQGKRVRRVAVAALFFVVLRRFPELVVEKIQFEVVGKVGDRRVILKDLGDAFADEGLIAFPLNLNEIGDINYFVDRTEFSSFGFTVLLNG